MIHFKKIRWKNILSTGSVFTEVLLDKSPNTVIYGENGVGKSSFLDALCFGLYGKPFRKIKKEQLINSINNRDALVEVEFTFSGHEALIVRGIKPNKFEIHIDGILIDQTAATKDYQDYLERNILHMNMKVFTQVVILGSASFVPFMQLPGGVRREVIEDLLDIQTFSLMLSLLKDRIQVNDYTIHSNFTTINAHEKIISVERERAHYEEDVVEHKLADLFEKANAVINNIAIMESNIAALDVEMEQLSGTNTSSATQKKLKQIDELVSDLAKKTKRIEKQRDFFKENDECFTCNQIIDAAFKTNRIDNFNGELDELLSASTKLLGMRSKLLTELDAMAKLAARLAKISAEATEARFDASILRKDHSFIQQQITELQSNVSTFSKENLDKLLQELNKIRMTREQLLKKQSMYSIATMMLKDGGIKSKIIRQYIPVINQLVNKYLAAMDFFVKFELNETFEERILSRHRDDFTYESFSEGEKMRIDLALLFAWRAIARAKNSISTNLLILDEVLDASLDGAGCDEFLKLMNMLENTNVFVISHRGDVLIDKFRSQIKFEKIGNYSRIAK